MGVDTPMAGTKKQATGRLGNTIASWIFGGVLLLVLVMVLFVIPEPSAAQRTILRYLMALDSGFLAYFLFGSVTVNGKIAGQAVRAGGGLALFVLMQFVFDPFVVKTTVADVAPGILTRDPVVAQAQKALSQEGYYHGKIDGIADTATRSAIAKLQKRSGIEPDGYARGKTRTALTALD